MRILIDECLPKRLKQTLAGHVAATVQEQGWSRSKNGELLRLAEGSFDVFITADQNLEFQQDLDRFNLGVVVLFALDNRLQTLLPLVPRLLEALRTIRPRQLVHIKA